MRIRFRVRNTVTSLSLQTLCFVGIAGGGLGRALGKSTIPDVVSSSTSIFFFVGILCINTENLIWISI